MKTDQQWQQELSPEEFRVCRQKGTEYPGTGEYLHHKEQGIYTCKCCGAELFKSEQKFDSGCGWPSFFDQLTTNAINRTEDYSHGMHRIEITCAACDSHLGHVFPDGPQPTGERYCVNSVSLNFKK